MSILALRYNRKDSKIICILLLVILYPVFFTGYIIFRDWRMLVTTIVLYTISTTQLVLILHKEKKEKAKMNKDEKEVSSTDG